MTESREIEHNLDTLTERQREVGELLARRLSYKEIAHELGISRDRVQKHVGELKKRLGVQALSEIVAIIQSGAQDRADNLPATKSGLPHEVPLWPKPGEDEPHVLPMPKAGTMNFMPAMSAPDAPRIVPRLLEGKHRVSIRLAIIAGLVVAAFSAIILAVAATQSVSELVRGTSFQRALEHKQQP